MLGILAGSRIILFFLSLQFGKCCGGKYWDDARLTSFLVLAVFIGHGIESSWFEETYPPLGSRDLTPRSVAKAAPLRILCLGASITYGLRSTDGNGYRYGLRGKLVEQGNDVNMIGSVKAGNMSNNNVEGWPGYEIDQITEKAKLSLPKMPNVVLICAGSKSA
jgi:hypothetical protein